MLRYIHVHVVAGKQQGECLNVQHSVPTLTLSVFVTSIAYNFRLAYRMANSIFALS